MHSSPPRRSPPPPPATPAAVAARLAQPRSTIDPALAAYRISIGRLDAPRPVC